MATVKDIAKLAGVSPTTVSWALNGKPVGKASLQKVLEAADQLNYRPQHSARSLRAGKVFSIGFYAINPNVDARLNGFIFPMLAGISKVLSDEHYSMQFDIVSESSIDLLTRRALENAVDGMAILPQFTGISANLVNQLPADIPLVFMQADASVNPPYCVTVDHAQGATTALQYLHTMGHRDIGVITGWSNHVDSHERLQAYYGAMQAMGLPVRPGWVQEGAFDFESGYDCMKAMLNAPDVPTAVFCFNDYMAVGAMRAVIDHGLRVPQDISIIGFDDMDIVKACQVPLTTIRQPFFEHGRESARFLLDLIHGREIQSPIVKMEPSLVIRDSVCRR